jgi:hypothetical protein
MGIVRQQGEATSAQLHRFAAAIDGHIVHGSKYDYGGKSDYGSQLVYRQQRGTKTKGRPKTQVAGHELWDQIGGVRRKPRKFRLAAGKLIMRRFWQSSALRY